MMTASGSIKVRRQRDEEVGGGEFTGIVTTGYIISLSSQQGGARAKSFHF